MTMFLIAACVVGAVVVVLLVVGLFLVARAGNRDTVSTAREDWITRRSDNDERGW